MQSPLDSSSAPLQRLKFRRIEDTPPDFLTSNRGRALDGGIQRVEEHCRKGVAPEPLLHLSSESG